MKQTLKGALVDAYRAVESCRAANSLIYQENCSRHNTAWRRSAYAAIAEVEGAECADFVRKGGQSRMACWMGVAKNSAAPYYQAPPKKTARDAWGEAPMKSQAGAYAQAMLY